jgi:opacity protein-like surface antigen
MMFRRLFAAVLAAGLLLLIGAPAYAAPPVTETTTSKNVVDTFVDVGPGCDDGALFTVTTTTNLIEHATVFDDGRIHATFTQSGTFVAVSLEDPSLTLTGHLAVWGGFNDNGKAVNGTFTFNINGTGSDGSRFHQNELEHFNTTPTGMEFFFTRCHN